MIERYSASSLRELKDIATIFPSQGQKILPYKKSESWTDRQIDRQTGRQTDRQTDGKMEREIDIGRQTGRQRDRIVKVWEETNRLRIDFL